MRRLVVALAGLALLLVGWLLATRPVGDEALRAHLHGAATGTVQQVQVLDPVYTRLTVAWADRTGAGHVSRFDTDTYDWQVDEPFDVVYDLRHPATARPADPEYTNDGALRVDARVQGAVPAGVGLLLLVVPTAVPLARRRRGERAVREGVVVDWRQLPVPAGPSCAWDEPRVQQRWLAYGRWSSRFAALGGVAAFAAALVLVLVHAHDLRLLRDGVRAQGHVLAGGGYSTRYQQDYVRVSYDDLRGHRHVAVLHGANPDDLRSGSTVQVLFDPSSPSSFRTPAYANHSNVTDDAMWMLPSAAGLLLVGSLWVAVAVRLGRRAMQRHPWVPAHVVAAGAGSWAQVPYLDLELQLPGSPRLTARLASASRSSLADFLVDVGEVVRVCPGEGRRFLVDAHGLSRPYVALLPRSARQARRWAEAAQ